MIQSIYLISLQAFAATTAFIAGSVIVATVLFLIFTSSVDEEKNKAKQKVYGLRGKYFFILSLLIIAGLFISLRLLPYEKHKGTPDENITVVAMQWAWKMGSGITDKSPMEFAGNNEITIPADKLVRFIVTSADVNHGFGIYNDAGLLITQVQAMPQYKNNLDFRFKEPGEYHIICMEYCGMPHGYMIGTIHVQ